MTAPMDDDFRTRHPTLWTVEALAWEYKEHEPEGDVLPGPKIQMGKRIQVAEVPDRPTRSPAPTTTSTAMPRRRMAG